MFFGCCAWTEERGPRSREQGVKTPGAKSKAVKASGDDWELTGDLTIHGVTKEVTTKVDRTGTGPGIEGETRTGAEAIFTIKRSDYGMTFMLPDGVSDEVTLIISLEAIKR